MAIRILIADDHQMMRQGLRSMLAEQPDFAVVGEASDGRAAVRMAADLSPAVAIMDVTMPDLNGIDATRQIKAESPDVKVVGLSMHPERQFVLEMLSVGASGYLLKDCPFDELVRAVRAAVAGDVYLSPKVASVVVRGRGGESTTGSLTPREREVLQLVAEGKNTKQVAQALHISTKTVETHRRQIMEKLNLYSTAELAHYAIREGLTPLNA